MIKLIIIVIKNSEYNKIIISNVLINLFYIFIINLQSFSTKK